MNDTDGERERSMCGVKSLSVTMVDRPSCFRSTLRGVLLPSRDAPVPSHCVKCGAHVCRRTQIQCQQSGKDLVSGLLTAQLLLLHSATVSRSVCVCVCVCV